MVRDQWNIKKNVYEIMRKGGGWYKYYRPNRNKKSFMSSQGEKNQWEFYATINWLKEL